MRKVQGGSYFFYQQALQKGLNRKYCLQNSLGIIMASSIYLQYSFCINIFQTSIFLKLTRQTMKKIAKVKNYKLQSKTKALRIGFSCEELTHQTPKFTIKSQLRRSGDLKDFATQIRQKSINNSLLYESIKMESAYKIQAECLKYNQREDKGNEERENRKKWDAILARCKNTDESADIIEIEREVRNLIEERKKRQKMQEEIGNIYTRSHKH